MKSCHLVSSLIYLEWPCKLFWCPKVVYTLKNLCNLCQGWPGGLDQGNFSTIKCSCCFVENFLESLRLLCTRLHEPGRNQDVLTSRGLNHENMRGLPKNSHQDSQFTLQSCFWTRCMIENNSRIFNSRPQGTLWLFLAENIKSEWAPECWLFLPGIAWKEARVTQGTI